MNEPAATTAPDSPAIDEDGAVDRGLHAEPDRPADSDDAVRGEQLPRGPWADDLAGAIAEVAAKIDALADCSDVGSSDRHVLDAIVELNRQVNRLSAQEARLLYDAQVRRSYAIDGAVTLQSWYGAETRTDPGDASRRVNAARRLRWLDRLRGAWEAGEVSARHVETITRAAIVRRSVARDRCTPTTRLPHFLRPAEENSSSAARRK